jgi:hypothetical protein
METARDLLDILLLEQKQHPEVSDASLVGTLRSVRSSTWQARSYFY